MITGSVFDAVKSGDLTYVKLLLDRGVDVNARTDVGARPLHLAVISGKAATVELLLQKGADVNAKGKGGWTPLYFAAWFGNAELVELLVVKGAMVNAENEVHQTASDLAALRSSKQHKMWSIS